MVQVQVLSQTSNQILRPGMHIPAIHALLGLEFPLVGVDEDLARRAKVLARVVRAHLAARLRAGRRRQARVRNRYAALVVFI